ncbi:MAG TPA: protein kinase [Thermoanaerobaculia bacterium]|nr:protein kinase [Thermoanaerobaculia bacterium]
MPFGPGSRLGPYEIIAPAGAGGMGEVYRARDIRLGRTVAIKVLPQEFSSDARLRVRFEREAKAISALTHPNICTLYDVGRENETDYLVMEFCEGETLAARLKRGAMPPSDAARIGADVASALAGAHERRLIHRDVKPDNIMLTRSGTRLLDFGLAGAEPEASHAETVSESTATAGIAGTLAYMAPERFEGEPADARSDIWSLGAIVYEMATGRPGFRGGSRTEVIVSVLTRDPDFEVIADPSLRHLVRKCLRKSPDQRWQSARDVADELRWIAEHGAGRRRVAVSAIGGIAALLAIAVAGVAGWATWHARPNADLPRLSVALPAESRLVTDTPSFALSPDASHIAFSIHRNEKHEIYSRPLDGFEPTLVAYGMNPVFSPNGRWIAFVRGRTLYKAPVDGGREHALAELESNPRGITWAPDGTIYFAIGFEGGLAKVSEDGSGFAIVTTPDASRDEKSHRWPHALPYGKHLLYTIVTGRMTSFSDAQIAVVSLESGRARTILQDGSSPTYVRTGHLVFARDRALMVVPFDLETLTVRGSPVPLLEDVLFTSISGAAHYAVADRAGTLAYAGGAYQTHSSFEIVDRRGGVREEFTVPRIVDAFRASPDSGRLAIQASAANDDIWSWDVQRRTLTRVSREAGDELRPTWAPDGKSILFIGRKRLYRQAADGSAPAELLLEGRIVSLASCSPGCEAVAFTVADRSRDIRILQPHRGTQPSLFAGTPFDEISPEFSPDGRSIAYVSNESGTWEIYLRPLSGSGRAQVSAGGGGEPRWSRDGDELYYRRGDQFFAVSMGPESPLEVGPPQLLFRLPRIRYWDVFGDGFILLKEQPPPFLASGIHILPDWLDEMDARVRRR